MLVRFRSQIWLQYQKRGGASAKNSGTNGKSHECRRRTGLHLRGNAEGGYRLALRPASRHIRTSGMHSGERGTLPAPRISGDTAGRQPQRLWTKASSRTTPREEQTSSTAARSGTGSRISGKRLLKEANGKAMDIDRYISLFRFKGEQLSGRDISPMYTELDSMVIEKLVERLPETKLIMIAREPVESPAPGRACACSIGAAGSIKKC